MRPTLRGLLQVPEPPLVEAARLGDASALQRLLAEPNAADLIDWSPLCTHGTPLYAAAVGNHAAVVRLLLAAGATASQAGRGDSTPLVAAAALGHEEIVRVLLDAGAAQSALADAAAQGLEALVERLLAAGANVNTKCSSMGLTPLHAAVMNSHAGVVQQLLAAGAEPNGGEADNSTLAVAAARGHTGIMQLLLAAGADPNWGHSRPLVCMARKGLEAPVQLLLAAGADPNLPNGASVTALMEAARSGHASVVGQLLAAGAAVDQSTLHGSRQTALHMAAEAGHEAVVEQLLAAGASVSLLEHPSGHDALWLATMKGHLGVVQRLLAVGTGNVDEALRASLRSFADVDAALAAMLPFASTAVAVRALRETKQWWRLPSVLEARLPLSRQDMDAAFPERTPHMRPVIPMLMRRHFMGENVLASLLEAVAYLPLEDSAWIRTGLLALHRPQMTVTPDNRAVPVSLPRSVVLHVVFKALSTL